MIRALKTFMSGVNRASEYVTAAMMLVMTLVIMFQVICRLFGKGFDFTEELARYLLIAIVMLGTGIGVHRGGNIGIEFLVNAVSPAWRRLLAVVMDLCCLLLFSEMIRHGWRALRIVGRQRSPSMQISLSIPYYFIYAGIIIIFLHLILHLLEQIFPQGRAETADDRPQ